MSAVNTWPAPGWGEPDHEETHAFLQCDVCWPPRVMTGSAATLRAAGWHFDSLAEGRHVCPVCPPRRRRRRRLSPKSKHPALPNLIVVGAEKSGTTSLNNYLDLHPEISMAADKELNFFQDPRCLDNLDDYAEYFDSRSELRGEACPTYTVYPLMPGAPERMRSAVPDAKLIYIVRDPVERAVADYAQFARLWGAPPPSSVFTNLSHPFHAFVAPGRYATQMEKLLDAFPVEQLLVVDQADLLRKRRETLRKIFAFLDVAEDFVSPEFDQLANTRDSVPVYTPLRRRLARSRITIGIRKLPTGLREPTFAAGNFLAAFGANPQPTRVGEAIRKQLAETYREETARFREMTGEAFSDWQT